MEARLKGMNMGRLVRAIVLAVLPAAWASGQAPDPPCAEFRVNTYTTGRQSQSSVGSAPDGRFLVVWSSDQEGDSGGIFGQRFDEAGVPQGPELHINTSTAGLQYSPQVAGTLGGGFVAVWGGNDGDGPGILGQRYNPAGAPLGSEFLVTTYTTGFQGPPSVASLAGGGFVVVWGDSGRGDGQLYGQRFDADGNPAGGDFRVDTDTSSTHYYGRVAASPGGGFLVVWESTGQDGSGSSIRGRLFDPQGAPVGGEFQVNSYTTGPQQAPDAAFDAAGNFVAVWSSYHDGSLTGVFGRRFDSAGVPQGDEFQVNLTTLFDQQEPRITRDSRGAFVVVWNDQFLDVKGRRLSAGGVPRGPEFHVNAYTTEHQAQPNVAATTNGRFVVAWQSNGQDGSGNGVFGSLDCSRLYTLASPCRLVDTRTPPGPLGGPRLLANTTRTFALVGTCSVPPEAQALALNVTVVAPTDFGDLRVYPTGEPPPVASTINFVPGGTRAVSAIVGVGTGGQVSVQCDMPAGSTGSTHLVLDATGYFKR